MSAAAAYVTAVGRTAIGAISAVGRAGYLGLSSLRALKKVRLWAPHLVEQMVRIGVESVPIALFISTFTGIVLALQASYTFTGAVPLYFVGALVGKTMILELGPVLTGLALSGRVGANIAAEIGTMRVTEQIDALETLAYDPVAYLIVPRVLAGALMFPMVVVLADAIGVLAGLGASMALLDLSAPQFMRGVRLFFRRVLLRLPYSGRGGRGWPVDDESGRGLEHDHPGARRLLGGRTPPMTVRRR